MKHGAAPLLADALVGLTELSAALDGYTAPGKTDGLKDDWFAKVDPLTAAPAPISPEQRKEAGVDAKEAEDVPEQA